MSYHSFLTLPLSPMAKPSSSKEPTRKPRQKPTPYVRKPKQVVDKNTPKTSATMPVVKKGRENLTLADWLSVFVFIDDHPLLSQEEVVRYFGEKKHGALTFSQSALSRNFKKRHELDARSQSTPMALSSKRVRVVTRPDVERALVLWIRHIEEMGETYTGDMLQSKRRRFEIMLQVPEEQRLSGKGWIHPFCRQFRIKEYRRHGEAGSVNLDAVATERERMQGLLEKYAPRDRLNFDESGMFWRYAFNLVYS